MHFMIKTVTHERLTDSRGRLIPTVISEWISETAKEGIHDQTASDQHPILVIAANPTVKQLELVDMMGWKLHDGKPNKADRADLAKSRAEYGPPERLRQGCGLQTETLTKTTFAGRHQAYTVADAASI